VAVDTYRHFAAAAGHCFVTQPTLSMQVQKLEEELGLKIFDRSKQPVIPTEAGRELIDQARKIISEPASSGNSTGKKGRPQRGAPHRHHPDPGSLPPAPVHPGLHGEVSADQAGGRGDDTDTVVARLREGRIDVASW